VLQCDSASAPKLKRSKTEVRHFWACSLNNRLLPSP